MAAILVVVVVVIVGSGGRVVGGGSVFFPAFSFPPSPSSGVIVQRSRDRRWCRAPCLTRSRYYTHHTRTHRAPVASAQTTAVLVGRLSCVVSLPLFSPGFAIIIIIMVLVVCEWAYRWVGARAPRVRVRARPIECVWRRCERERCRCECARRTERGRMKMASSSRDTEPGKTMSSHHHKYSSRIVSKTRTDAAFWGEGSVCRSTFARSPE